MRSPLLDVVFFVMWIGVPLAVIVVAHRRLRAAGSNAVGPWAVAAAAVGLTTLAVALAPSTSVAAERTFAGHMAQHLAIGLFAPLLLVIGRVPELLPWALVQPRRRALRRRGRRILAPPRSMKGPTIAMVAVWYAWHVPWFYGAAVRWPLVHVLEHATILGAGLWFWSAAAPQRRRVGTAVVGLFLVTVANGLLAATLSLSPVSFYDGHVAATTIAGRLDDQHLGGLLMWTPGGLVYLVAAVAQLLRWLGAHEEQGTTARAPEAAVT